MKLLTAGVDVQDDRLELGSSAGARLGKLVNRLQSNLRQSGMKRTLGRIKKLSHPREFYDSEENILKIKSVGIDSGGHHTDKVYDFCQANTGHQIFFA